jgi:hypothetical protein
MASGLEEGTYQIADGFFAFTCNQAPIIPDIYFMFGEVWHQMQKEDYVFDASEF